MVKAQIHLCITIQTNWGGGGGGGGGYNVNNVIWTILHNNYISSYNYQKNYVRESSRSLQTVGFLVIGGFVFSKR